MRTVFFICLGILGMAFQVEAGPLPQIGSAAFVGATPSLREIAMPTPRQAKAVETLGLREIPRGDRSAKRSSRRAARTADGALQTNAPSGLMPDPLFTFEGPSNLDSVAPPDPSGDVGPNHYIAMVNMHFCIYAKETGEPLIEPMLMSQLFAAAGFPPPASTTDSGDPIVLYDPLADRWMISQFIVSENPCHELIAISQTADPTGAWFLYDFVMPNNKMNDYPKFGVWPDGYYMSDNQFNPDNSYGGVGVFVFEREKMLVGNTNATFQYFDLAEVSDQYFGLLPADLDGPPPTVSTPNYFAMVDDEVVNPMDALYVWEFHVDWENPANSTFGNAGRPNCTNAVASFNSVFPLDRNTVPQPGVSQRLDPIGDRLMHRLQYRNFGAHESLVVCHTVNVGNSQAGTRYYELRRPLPSGEFFVKEQATFAPDAVNRWMGSAALDGQGNLAVGYSVSSTSVYPSIRYAGRLAADPSNGLFLGESTLWEGSASQTSANRWGDYTTMSVDPVDDTRFWYINQYTEGGWNWRTRIGCFQIGDLQLGTVTGDIRNALTGAGISDISLRFSSGMIRTADDQGQFSFPFSTGIYTVVASAPGYYAMTSTPFEVNLNSTTAVNWVMSPVPLNLWPKDGFVATGTEGGPFSPATQTYWLSNACLDEVTWTASNGPSWLSLSATTGTLPPGGITDLVCRVNSSADFLEGGSYADTVAVSWSTPGEEGIENRPCQLAIDLWQPPVLAQWNFSEGLPDGWSIEGEGWRFDDPGNRRNLTGGAGGFAIADSDYVGEFPMDTQLQTPPLVGNPNMAGLLSFRTDYRVYSGNEIAAVDVSTNGVAGPWENLWQRSVGERGPTNITLALPDLGSTNARVRFHYSAFWDYWWQVDDVTFCGYRKDDGAVQAMPLAGLHMSGYTGDPVNQPRTYRLTNSAADEVAWTARCTAAWFDVEPRSGTIPAGNVALVTVQATEVALDLVSGTYEGSVEFSNSGDDGLAIRPVTLSLLEPLTLSPTSNYVARGLEGGPFTPAAITYTLENHSAHPVPWATIGTTPWLQLSATNGTLLASTTESITATLTTNALTTPGLFSDQITFSNLLTGAMFTRAVTVTVVEITGRIATSDSISPTNDQYMPFGVVTGSTPRVETVTVRNTGENNRPLTISEILLGYYQTSFDEDAEGWQSMHPENWAVTNGAYRATASQGWMISSYMPQTWSDTTVEVSMRRSGDPALSQGLILRGTEDFEELVTGSAYLFLISGNNYFSVFRCVDGEITNLQGWTYTTALKASTNRLAATASGDQLSFVINGTMVWEGTDATLPRGHVSLCGYASTNIPTLYAFDDVRVTRPQPRPLGVGRKQLYFNGLAQTASRPEGPNTGKPLPSAPLWPEELETVSSPLSVNYFTLTNLPALPAVLAPNEEFQFNVIYEPETVITNADNVIIRNNDNFNPEVEVLLDARAASARLLGQITDADTALPISSALVEVDNGVTTWSTRTSTNGQYVLLLPAGTWPFAWNVSQTNYTTNSGSLLLPVDGLVITQNMELAGSRLTVGPTTLDRMVQPGGRITNELVFSNSGPLSVSCAIAVTSIPPATATWCQLETTMLTVPPGGIQSVAVVFDASVFTSPPPTVSRAELVFSGSFVNPLPPSPMTLRVTSGALAVLPVESQSVLGCVAGPFSPDSISYTVRNLGSTALNWSASAGSVWIGLNSTGGTLAAGASVDVTARVNTNAEAFALGRYTGWIQFSNRTAHVEERRSIELLVLPARSNVVSYGMDVDPGWRTQGAWAFGVPQGGGSHNLDPHAGVSGTNVYGYNLAGDYSSDLPRRSLTTLPVNASHWIHLELEFQRWLGIEGSAYDQASVECSADGQNWIELWRHQSKEITDTQWTTVTLPLPTAMATNSALQLRWVMGATDESVTYPGWNLDDVVIRGNRLRQLTIQSVTDQSMPAVGAHDLPEAVPVTCVITQTFVETVSTQFVFVGWTGSGDVPASGTDPNVTFTLTQDSALVWQWATNVYFSKTAATNGYISGSDNGWYSLNETVLLLAVPDDQFEFAGWLGTSESQSMNNPLLLTLDRARDVVAKFVHTPPTLTIHSPHGNPEPPEGLSTNLFGSVVTNRVTSPDTQGRTQYVCTGWVMISNEPATGTGTVFSMMHTNHAELTWTWRTNYLFTHASDGRGSVIGNSTGWYGKGSPVLVFAATDPYFHFDQWSGEISGATNPLFLTMTRPWDLTANFDENRTTNTGTPEWWLARYGWSNEFEAAAAGDEDHDGVPTSDEYLADTIPTNSNSFLLMNGVTHAQVQWHGGTGVVQYLEWSDDGLNSWQVWTTNLPPTAVTNSTPLPAGADQGFFRIRTTR